MQTPSRPNRARRRRPGFLSLLLAVAVAAPSAADETLDDLIHRGVASYAAGDLAGADAVWQRIRLVDPLHPAAPIFELETLEARRSLDYFGGEYDAAIRARAEEGVTLARAWLEREPGSATANFYLGRGLVELMVIYATDGEYYRAAKAVRSGQAHLERALALDPALVDAKLPLGLSYYYTSIATRYLPFLRWLWFVPDGDHDAGLALMEEVRREGDLLRYSAAETLAGLYVYVDERPDLSKPILAELHALYPRNTYVHFELVELLFSRGDYAGTIAAARALETGAGTQFGDETRRKMARIWRARAELQRGEAERADAIVRALAQDEEGLTSWTRRWLLVTRANLHDLAGERAQAVSLYEKLRGETTRWGSRRTAKLAQAYLGEPFRLEGVPSVASGP